MTVASKELQREARAAGARVRAALRNALSVAVPHARFDERGYVVDPDDNLLPAVNRADIEAEFGAGAGNELDSKMRAPWSSSALAVNSFGPFRGHVSALRLAGLDGFSGHLAFE